MYSRVEYHPIDVFLGRLVMGSKMVKPRNIFNPESGNSILLGTGASPPESGNSILDTYTRY